MLPQRYFTREFYEHIYQLANDSIIVVDREKEEIVLANSKTLELYGYSESELKGFKIYQLNVEQQDKVKNYMDKVAASSKGYAFQSKHRKKNGEILDVEVNSRLFVLDGREYFISIVRDITDKKQIERDAEMAKAVQRSLMPESIFEYSRFKCSAFYQPLMQVSGDMYDLVPLDDHRLAVLVADVMGHGTAAALYTAAIKLFFRDKIRKCNFPSEFLSKLNRYFSYNSGQIDVFLGAICLIFDSRTSSVICSNGGINEFFFYQQAKAGCQIIENKGPFIGMFPNSHYVDYGLRLDSGDRLYLCTDGLLDLRGKGKNFTPYKLWRKLILEDDGFDAEQIFTSYLNGLKMFGDPLELLRDDLTLLKIDYI